jgi:hypothetical protein
MLLTLFTAFAVGLAFVVSMATIYLGLALRDRDKDHE